MLSFCKNIWVFRVQFNIKVVPLHAYSKNKSYESTYKTDWISAVA